MDINLDVVLEWLVRTILYTASNVSSEILDTYVNDEEEESTKNTM